MTLAQERDVWTEYQHATGEERARLEDELAWEHKGLAISLARKFDNVEESEGEAMFGLLRAIRNYDPSVKTTFSTFAVPVIRNQLISAYQKQMNGNNRANTLAFSLNAPVQGESGTTQWEEVLEDGNKLVEDRATEMIVAEKVLEIVERHFDDREKVVFRGRFPKYGKPLTFDEIGEHIDLTGMAVSNMYHNLIYKLAKCCNGMDPELVFAPRRREWSESELEELNDMILKGFSRKEIRLRFNYRTKDSMNQKITVVRKKLKKEGLL